MPAVCSGTKCLRAVSLTLLCGLMATSGVFANGPEIDLTEGVPVEVSELETGAGVLALSLRRYPAGGVARTEEWVGVATDTAAEGVVHLTDLLGQDRQLVVAIDLASGKVGGARSADLEPIAAELTPGAMAPTSGSVVLPASEVLAAIVRPGVAAWLTRAADGSPSDLDGIADGSLTLGLSAAEQLHGAEALFVGVEAGDVVVVIEPRALDFDVFSVGVE